MSSPILDEYEELSKQKDAIEAEIAAIAGELTSGPNAPGLRGPLVDAEGFPRADIDVYRVRHQRHNFACKQTDHRLVMEKIEKLLPLLFEARKQTKTSSAVSKPQPPPPSDAHAIPVRDTTANVRATDQLSELLKTRRPFALVESVQDESPAALAGLQVGDHVLSFGTADATNHRNLEAIRDIVLRNVGSPIPVVIARRGTRASADKSDEEESVSSMEVHELSLTPKKWRGAGMLGCLIVPFAVADAAAQP